MPSNTFTRLLLQRIRELTNPNRPNEEIEENLREYYSAIVEIRQQREIVNADELSGLESRINQLRAEFRERGYEEERLSFLDIAPREREVLGSILRRLSSIEADLKSLQAVNDAEKMLNSFENRLKQLSYQSVITERLFIEEYLSMDLTDFYSMTTEMHTLFLERMLESNFEVPIHSAQRLIDVYQRKPSSIIRYIIIHVMLKLSQNGEQDNNYAFRLLFDAIYNNEGNNRAKMLAEVANILIDIGTNMLIMNDSINNNPAFRVLDFLIDVEKIRETSYLSNAIQLRLSNQ